MIMKLGKVRRHVDFMPPHVRVSMPAVVEPFETWELGRNCWLGCATTDQADAGRNGSFRKKTEKSEKSEV